MKSFLLNKIILKTLLFTITLITFTTCKKDDNNNLEGTSDNYYVKYVISSIYPRIFSNWSVTTPQGKYTKNDYQTRRWEQTYGPVKKGFNCEVLVGSGEPTIEIYVSKNQEPFALKTTKDGKSATYVINF